MGIGITDSIQCPVEDGWDHLVIFPETQQKKLTWGDFGWFALFPKQGETTTDPLTFSKVLDPVFRALLETESTRCSSTLISAFGMPAVEVQSSIR